MIGASSAASSANRGSPHSKMCAWKVGALSTESGSSASYAWQRTAAACSAAISSAVSRPGSRCIWRPMLPTTSAVCSSPSQLDSAACVGGEFQLWNGTARLAVVLLLAWVDTSDATATASMAPVSGLALAPVAAARAALAKFERRIRGGKKGAGPEKETHFHLQTVGKVY